MIRAVLDTNVIVSGLISYESAGVPPSRILRAWTGGRFTALTSGPILAEVERALVKQYFLTRIPLEKRTAFVTTLRTESESVVLSVHVAGVATHPEDDLVLATAASARADYLVTGDRQLLRLGSFEGVSIISPADFLIVLDREGREPVETVVP